ncbi:uncharacterized protein MKZ38_008384 [Zalerion maritima]|uniref:Uncharacterized protein n=1 Tax=Zalerion maritima TaxID=339359 RepID=A0AAD5RH77_9PEZI|nr:uncharacterized protein MKZ38_008384 [Zalerion maritima]
MTVTLLAIFAARAIAVPLSPVFPAAELQYIINQSGAIVLCSSPKFLSKAQDVMSMDIEDPPSLLALDKHMGSSDTTSTDSDSDPDFEEVTLEGEGASAVGDSGMMLYTSGTTNRPKGVLLPSRVLMAQCMSLMEAWQYTEEDHVLHVLPLHHIHGTVNALLTPLLAGSTVEFLFPFNADKAWRRFAAPFQESNGEGAAGNMKDKITFFTVVPTVYSRLLATFKDLQPEVQKAAEEGISRENLRLNISGSAALPTPLKQAWTDLSGGNVLLERYGMTEVGMALSCGLDDADRVDGSVGWPLPGVEARLVDLDTGEVIKEGEEALAPASSSTSAAAAAAAAANGNGNRHPNGDSTKSEGEPRERQGEIQLRGPTIFKEYFRNPDATRKEFSPAHRSDPNQAKWFKTGDVAVRRTASCPKTGAGLSGAWARGANLYFIQGRLSADIIKSGGEKVSALEVERELLSLPQVSEAAVVAVPSGKWGQKVGCVLVLDRDVVEPGKKWSPMDMRRALKSRLANYKIPQVMKVVEGGIKRNAMGKVNKKVLVQEVFEDEFSGDEM